MYHLILEFSYFNFDGRIRTGCPRLVAFLGRFTQTLQEFCVIMANRKKKALQLLRRKAWSVNTLCRKLIDVFKTDNAFYYVNCDVLQVSSALRKAITEHV